MGHRHLVGSVIGSGDGCPCWGTQMAVKFDVLTLSCWWQWLSLALHPGSSF